MEIKHETMLINGVEYVRKDSVMANPSPNGNRAVVVIDRGWIYAGDVTEENGRIYLDRAVWVFKWNEIGFDGVIENPKNSKVTIRKMKNRIDIPVGSEVYRIPVDDNWGL